MAESWDRVLESQGYQVLPRAQQLAAKRQYFQELVAPRVGGDQRALNDAYLQFMAYRPIELGDRETLLRSAESGLREGWAGMLRTAGALRTYAGEHPSAEMGLDPEAMQPVYGLGDPQFQQADRQTDLAQKATLQPGEHGPWYDRLLGGATGIVAAPFAAQQAATTQLRRGASEGQAILAAAAETPASALQIAAPGVGGKLGGLVGPGLKGLAAKAVGGGLAGGLAEPVATAVRNLGLPEAQRHHRRSHPKAWAKARCSDCWRAGRRYRRRSRGRGWQGSRCMRASPSTSSCAGCCRRRARRSVQAWRGWRCMRACRNISNCTD